jgi:hypothetical protein
LIFFHEIEGKEDGKPGRPSVWLLRTPTFSEHESRLIEPLTKKNKHFCEIARANGAFYGSTPAYFKFAVLSFPMVA